MRVIKKYLTRLIRGRKSIGVTQISFLKNCNFIHLRHESYFDCVKTSEANLDQNSRQDKKGFHIFYWDHPGVLHQGPEQSQL